MVTHPYFTAETIAKEQGIIGQEIKMYDDSPDWRLMNTLLSCLYENHPIREDIAGSCEGIAQLTPGCYDCCRAFYQPGNLVLAAAGNITMEQLAYGPCRTGQAAPAGTGGKTLAGESPAVAQPQKDHVCRCLCRGWASGLKASSPSRREDLRTEALYDLICGCILGGMSPLYRRLYDQGLVDPDFGGSVLHTEGCCCSCLQGRAAARSLCSRCCWRRSHGCAKRAMDREVFTLCKHERYGQLIENLENVERIPPARWRTLHLQGRQ